MRKIIILVFIMLLPTFLQSQNTVFLENAWEYTQAGSDEWRPAKVPGSVQQYLIEEKILPDPFWGANEKLVQWPEEQDWDFRNIFQLTKEQLSHDEIFLNLEGLDTHAELFLNGANILRADNMFLGYSVPVKDLLLEGENRLYIRFYSPLKLLSPQRLSAGFEYPAGNDHRKERVSVYSRKAPYHFGWDWGMRLVQMGIWRPVSLSFHNKCRINDSYLRQLSVNSVRAVLQQVLELESFDSLPSKAKLYLNCLFEGKRVFLKEQDLVLTKGKNRITSDVEVLSPQLWMPAGWGKQSQYDFVTTVEIDGKLIAEKKQRVGLRSVKVVNEVDSLGKSFYFEVNGIPLFAKGANYIPGEIINTKQDKAYYDRLFENVAAANMNMIRVWGGGFYEDNYFYEKADEMGILVWQDFMFACSPYPGDASFLENVKQEAEYNIKRLRNYACIALWCGNNEVEESLKYWGFGKQFSKTVMDGFWTSYNKLFLGVLPDMLKEYAPDAYYLHSSPEIANWGRPQTFGFGDSHYWGVWYGREPFEVLDKNIPRFMSEFGVQSFPEMKTIRSFASPEDYALDSEVMTTHQKSSIGNEVIKEYMDRYYREPKDFDSFVYLSSVMQGAGMRHGIEAHRRNRPYCMGTLYWQLNDSWPVVSWSGIDYYGNWKALHYQTRRAFAPVAINMIKEEDKLNTYLFSDLLEDFKELTLSLELIDFEGRPLERVDCSVSLPANSSSQVLSLDLEQFAGVETQQNSFVRLLLKDKKGKVLARNNFFFHWPKELKLPQVKLKTSLKRRDGEYILTLRSATLVKDVFIEIPIQGAHFSDNFFDLLPGEKKEVIIRSPQLKAKGQVDVNIIHVRDTY